MPVAVSTFNARIDRCRSGGDHILVVWCGGLTRPDPTPIILAVSLTSGFPRHPARAPTSYQTDAAMIPRFPPPPPAPHVVARQLAAPPRPPLSGHEWQLLKRGVGILATRATATTAAHGHPHHTTPIHYTIPEGAKIRRDGGRALASNGRRPHGSRQSYWILGTETRPR